WTVPSQPLLPPPTDRQSRAKSPRSPPSELHPPSCSFTSWLLIHAPARHATRVPSRRRLRFRFQSMASLVVNCAGPGARVERAARIVPVIDDRAERIRVRCPSGRAGPNPPPPSILPRGCAPGLMEETRIDGLTPIPRPERLVDLDVHRLAEEV